MKTIWPTRMLCLFALAFILQGCATYIASEMAPDERGFYNNPILSDEILAIGRPDENLLKQMGLSNTIAFIGKENTYMLYLGGEELEQISKLKLDSKRMYLESNQRLFLKGKQIWGEIKVFYDSKKGASPQEMTELELGGFMPIQTSSSSRYSNKGNYSNTVRIEGVVYPAIKIPDDQLSKLKVSRKFNLFNPREASPPVLLKALKAPIIATGVVVDVMLAPVYLGAGAVVLLGAAASR